MPLGGFSSSLCKRLPEGKHPSSSYFKDLRGAVWVPGFGAPILFHHKWKKRPGVGARKGPPNFRKWPRLADDVEYVDCFDRFHMFPPFSTDENAKWLMWNSRVNLSPVPNASNLRLFRLASGQNIQVPLDPLGHGDLQIWAINVQEWHVTWHGTVYICIWLYDMGVVAIPYLVRKKYQTKHQVQKNVRCPY